MGKEIQRIFYINRMDGGLGSFLFCYVVVCSADTEITCSDEFKYTIAASLMT